MVLPHTQAETASQQHSTKNGLSSAQVFAVFIFHMADWIHTVWFSALQCFLQTTGSAVAQTHWRCAAADLSALQRIHATYLALNTVSLHFWLFVCFKWTPCPTITWSQRRNPRQWTPVSRVSACLSPARKCAHQASANKHWSTDCFVCSDLSLFRTLVDCTVMTCMLLKWSCCCLCDALVKMTNFSFLVYCACHYQTDTIIFTFF